MSNMKLDQMIESSLLPEKSKQILNEVLMVEFGGDWNLLLKDMECEAAKNEEYEVAAEIRDYLIKYN